MKTPIRLPDLDMDPVVFGHWYAHLGDQVEAGERLAEVVGPSATFDVSSPCSGILVEHYVYPNDRLLAGQLLATIESTHSAGEEP